MTEIQCIYKDNCSDEPGLCEACVNNKGKRSHYVPDTVPYTPYVPYVPYIPYPTTPTYPWYPYNPWIVTYSNNANKG